MCFQVVKTHRDVERKAILQMAVARVATSGSVPSTPTAAAAAAASSGATGQQATQTQRHLLLSLTEDGVNVRSLPDAMLRFQAQRTRGATCMAWNEGLGVLAVYVKRWGE